MLYTLNSLPIDVVALAEGINDVKFHVVGLTNLLRVTNV